MTYSQPAFWKYHLPVWPLCSRDLFSAWFISLFNLMWHCSLPMGFTGKKIGFVENGHTVCNKNNTAFTELVTYVISYKRYPSSLLFPCSKELIVTLNQCDWGNGLATIGIHCSPLLWSNFTGFLLYKLIIRSGFCL